MDATERCGNRRPRVERLVSAWNQGIREDAESECEADDPLIGASAEPKKRPRTRLTDEEVDAMRTARANGVSVRALARQFRVYRATVWAKTRLVGTGDGKAWHRLVQFRRSAMTDSDAPRFSAIQARTTFTPSR